MKLTRYPKYRPPVWATECRQFVLTPVIGETHVQNQARMFAAQAAYIAGDTFTPKEFTNGHTTHQ